MKLSGLCRDITVRRAEARINNESSQDFVKSAHVVESVSRILRGYTKNGTCFTGWQKLLRTAINI